MNITTESGRNPSDLASIRTEVAGLFRYDTLEIPVLPEHGRRLMALAGKPLADTAELARLVAEERLAEARLLRVAQFAAYQPSSPITSLEEAIAWLGAGEVADMAFTVLVQRILFQGLRDTCRADDRWRASIAAAIWAREIGAVSRHRSSLTYLCGLLHDVGAQLAQLSCFETAAKLGLRLKPDEQESFVQEFGPQFAELVVARWSLPRAIAECVTGWAHWTPARETSDQVPVVHLAHHLAEIVTRQGEEFAREALQGNAALDFLNITPDRFSALLDRTRWVMNQVGAY